MESSKSIKLFLQCDEAHPTCGACKKVGTECKYTYGHVSKFVNYHQESSPASSSRSTSGDVKRDSKSKDKKHKSKDREMVLSLRSSNNVQSGSNLMQTFNLVPVNRGTPEESTGYRDNTTLESTIESSLLPHWLSYLENGDSSLYCLGDWVDIVQQYIGRSEIVDAAVIAVISGAVAYSSRKEQDIATARESNINALRVLRLSLSRYSQGTDSRGALVATKLLYIAEVCVIDPSQVEAGRADKFRSSL